MKYPHCTRCKIDITTIIIPANIGFFALLRLWRDLTTKQFKCSACEVALQELQTTVDTERKMEYTD